MVRAGAVSSTPLVVGASRGISGDSMGDHGLDGSGRAQNGSRGRRAVVGVCVCGAALLAVACVLLLRVPETEDRVVLDESMVHDITDPHVLQAMLRRAQDELSDAKAREKRASEHLKSA